MLGDHSFPADRCADRLRGHVGNVQVAGASGGSYTRANTAGASTSITFNGVRFQWIATKGTTMGSALLTIDGGAPITVNLANAGTLYQQMVWSSGILTPGVHTVNISWNPANAAGRYINVDAVDVIGTLQ